MFFTAVLATLAGGYAIYTVFDSIFFASVFGLVWGFMIFNLDRFIVSSMKNRGKFIQDFMVAAPRIALAVVIALVISRPIELRLFDKEIQAELVTMEQEIILEQEDQLRLRYSGQIAENEAQILAFENTTQQKAVLRDNLVAQAIEEADGTGGSLKRNMGPIYKAKKAEADRAELEYQSELSRVAPLIASAQQSIQELNALADAELAAIERVPYNGMAARMEALDRVANRSQAVSTAHIFIILLFLIIESAPVLVKLISRRSPYDLLLHKHEHEFEMFHHEKTRLSENTTMNKVKYETEVGTHITHAKIREERAKIDHEVGQTIEELKKSIGWSRS